MVSRGGRLSHGRGTLSAQLEVALDAGGGVVRTLALVAVRQEEYQAGQLAPLGLTGGDVLIDDGLRTVGEVTELGLPRHDGVRVTHGVAVLEAHAGVLGQG